MKFLVDAQLPRHLAGWLREAGHEASHTLDLPNVNRTTDAEITALSIWGQTWSSPRAPILCGVIY